MPDQRTTLRIGHSPDPDDAFMWWPLLSVDGGAPALDTGRFRFEAITDDIEVLNQRSASAELEITAMSCAQYPHVRDRYAITACGASMGDAYGPKLVSSRPLGIEDLRGGACSIAVPGERTTAFATLSLMLGRGAFPYEVMPFDRIIAAVADGSVDAGLVIHEGQLTYGASGLRLVEDLGRWWHATHRSPLPLGLNTIRRDLDDRFGPGTLREVTRLLQRSVAHAMEHRDRSVAYALRYARDMEAELAGAFIDLYVNGWTLHFGVDGRRAVQAYLDAVHRAGLVPDPGTIDLVEPVE